jgi:hypothetical protein
MSEKIVAIITNVNRLKGKVFATAGPFADVDKAEMFARQNSLKEAYYMQGSKYLYIPKEQTDVTHEPTDTDGGIGTARPYPKPETPKTGRNWLGSKKP